jgi:hypothetical protein
MAGVEPEEEWRKKGTCEMYLRKRQTGLLTRMNEYSET